jgi:hypothetical protein
MQTAMNGPRVALALCLHILCGCDGRNESPVGPVMDASPLFWVWHRSTPLQEAEVRAINESGVKRLYWQVAECRWEGDAWHFKRIAKPMADVSGIRMVPVFRIEPQAAFLGAPDAGHSFVEMLRRWSGDKNAIGEFQLDFDCPDRLLGSYADFLTDIREQTSAYISITALAGWPSRLDFKKLARAVDAFAPMFYDLHADDEADAREGKFQPMAHSEISQSIANWSRCPKPWFAGLPNFERLSVFAANGELIGHMREWRHELLWFHPYLERGQSSLGTTVFLPTEAVNLSGTRVLPGMRVVHRIPEVEELSKLVDSARVAGASGVIWFALPGPGMRAAFSLEHLANLGRTAQLELVIADDGTVVLTNTGPADLAPSEWELVIRAAEAGQFRSASPGGFSEVSFEGILPAELSDAIVLRFARLPAGESLVSGSLIARTENLSWMIEGFMDKKPLVREKSAR